MAFLCNKKTRKPLNEENPYILMVDDSAIVSKRLAVMLHETGVPWRVAWARNYDQAMDMMAAETGTPAVVVLDINLPGRNGLDLLHTIKAMHRQVTVVMLTNRVEKYYRQQARHLGADHFLDKSNDFEQLPGLLYNLVYPGK
jgi:CheY-like chemotaxis protein